MKQVFICEGRFGDIEVRLEGAEVRLTLAQDQDSIHMDAKQRDELRIALDQITFPGEDLETDEDDE